MARKKKTTNDSTTELDAFIDRESTHGKGCPLCQPKVLAELKRLEKRLKQKGKRVSIKAVNRWLASKKLLELSPSRLSSRLQRPEHLNFYNYLKGQA